MTTLDVSPDLVALPDGTFARGPLTGSQQPRFWTAPSRHRSKDPGCRMCDDSDRDYSASTGCGNYQSYDLLDWCPDIGYDLDEWQRWWLTEACGTKPDGRWSAFECALIVSRQNGKNQCLEVRELGGLFLFGERTIIHTAHEFKASVEHFRRVRDTITNYDALSKRVKSITTSHGDEAIELRPRPTLVFGAGSKRVRKMATSRLRFLARSRGSGRSFSADCLVYDEAMLLSDDHVGASMPTMSAMPNPQMIYTASAGYSDSVQLAAVRRRVLRDEKTLMGAEWSIRPHLDTCSRDEIAGRKTNRYIVCGLHDDRDDPRNWAKSNPAVGLRIRIDHIRQEMNAMSPATFDRERLGVGDWPNEDEAWAVVSEDQWEACALADPGGTVRPVAFAVDVAPDLTSATIAAAWEKPGMVTKGMDISELTANTRRTVIEIPKGCSREGVSWVIPRLAELKSAWKPAAIVLPKNGPAAGLIDEAEQKGLDVLTASSADEAAAFSLVVTGVQAKPPSIAHLGQEHAPGLWHAVATAVTRDIGDGGRGWSRRDSDADITPITAGTLAAWGLNKKRRSYDPLRSIG